MKSLHIVQRIDDVNLVLSKVALDNREERSASWFSRGVRLPLHCLFGVCRLQSRRTIVRQPVNVVGKDNNALVLYRIVYRRDCGLTWGGNGTCLLAILSVSLYLNRHS
ncbi:hypothetical protein BKA82DRAFT_1000691 [Pisolithus tinctorius]|uniref:Uncharacterized protein n=1 Tax=Pisolithus tinctorius Marx 270 TaxID=870435 RepID=A0A0C3P9H6_PISTI|nr:hypothetical protein BKA82DRAFT_1000691 [Pisolithus tinctorius]KIO04194.1 hypothetical protein M404DRAFT_1000691 [Pisolithus tinctorius Marx 270]